MKKKTVLTVILTALIVLSAAVLGVANVFRVDGVVVNAPMVSDAAKAEAEALQEELAMVYQGENTLFANEAKAEEVFAKYPYFRLTSFEKEFPNILVIEDGRAYLSDANCPDKLCVHQGKISRTGEVITCLPNKLTVTVFGAEESVDLIS